MAGRPAAAGTCHGGSWTDHTVADGEVGTSHIVSVGHTVVADVGVDIGHVAAVGTCHFAILRIGSHM